MFKTRRDGGVAWEIARRGYEHRQPFTTRADGGAGAILRCRGFARWSVRLRRVGENCRKCIKLPNMFDFVRIKCITVCEIMQALLQKKLFKPALIKNGGYDGGCDRKGKAAVMCCGSAGCAAGGGAKRSGWGSAVRVLAQTHGLWRRRASVSRKLGIHECTEKRAGRGGGCVWAFARAAAQSCGAGKSHQ